MDVETDLNYLFKESVPAVNMVLSQAMEMQVEFYDHRMTPTQLNLAQMKN